MHVHSDFYTFSLHDALPILVVIAGVAAMMLPKLASKQKVDVATLNVPAGPTEAEVAAEKKAEELATKHAELAKKIVELDERSEEHTSELQSLRHLVCRLLLE